MNGDHEFSPRAMARLAGAFYGLLTITALFAEFFVRGRLVVRNDPAATLANVLSDAPLHRLGFVADIVTLLCDTAVAILLYWILRPAGANASLLAAVFRLMMVPLLAMAALLHFALLTLAQGHPSGDQLELARAALGLRGISANLAMVFFGVHLMLVGYLVRRSTFLPHVLGVLLIVAGAGYVANSVVRYLAPGAMAPFFPFVAASWAIAEWSFALWLIIAGVNVLKWKAQASAAHRGPSDDPGTSDPLTL